MATTTRARTSAASTSARTVTPTRWTCTATCPPAPATARPSRRSSRTPPESSRVSLGGDLGGDFHAGAEQPELDVVHHGDAERLAGCGVELRGDRLGAGPPDPRRLMAAHRLTADA